MTDTASNPHVYLPGLALAGFRSFGPNIQFMGPFTQINVFAGPNNVGKSNILRFIHRHLGAYGFHNENPVEGVAKINQPADFFRGVKPSLTIGLPVPTTETAIRRAIPRASGQQVNIIQDCLRAPIMSQGTPLSWLFEIYDDLEGTPVVSHVREPFRSQVDGFELSDPSFWGHRMWDSSDGRDRVESNSQLLLLCYRDLKPLIKPTPKVRYVPAFRQIRPQGQGRGQSFKDYDGDGNNLIELYASLEQADHTEHDRTRPMVESIHRFLVDVTGEASIRLKVPYHRRFFEVARGGTPEPLEVLGSGIHQLILLAVEVTLHHNEIVCLEEPEVFLHPILQRKLIEYLNTTSNQYFISTHSAQFLDVPDVAVFHLETTKDGTKVTKAETSSHRFAVCRDLGYRASDIVQANCVIWVEGPSELIYLRKWIGEIDDTLREGIEYSVMFYGGSLSSWLTGDDPEEAEELISLVAINRHSAFLMDSDKEAESSELKAGKVKVKDSIKSNGGFTWVTQGREIENYLPFSQRVRCFQTLKSSAADLIVDGGLYGFGYPRNDQGKPIVKKTKLANAVRDEPVEWGDTDLKDQVVELVNYIRIANGLTRV
ncbi:MAG: family endonuclease [Planctomycetaceae bacterium]|nr:family endonuclease [Planctomycetaceae bacterium]